MTHRIAAAVAAALLAGPVLAEQAILHDGVEAASLHEGPLDMMAQSAPAQGGALEVSATFASPAVRMMSAAPMRVVLSLGDGERVDFVVPGYPEARYRFSRAGAAVTVSVRRVRLDGPGVAGL